MQVSVQIFGIGEQTLWDSGKEKKEKEEGKKEEEEGREGGEGGGSMGNHWGPQQLELLRGR